MLPPNYSLHDPWWLLALLVLPLIVWVRGRRGAPVLVVPFAGAWHKPSFIPTSRWAVSFALTGLVLLVGALARPQYVEDKREVKQQGYDLMLAIDLSGSMLAEDYERAGERINRLQAIKPVIQAFINRRTNDRIGLVIFSGRAYTLAPLTFDHDWLAKQIERFTVKMTISLEQGTAIGDGLGVALTRLEQAGREEGSHRKGAFVVLLTDGANNSGLLTPAQAAEIAKSRHIPVYTIGIGREGYVDMPGINPDGSFQTNGFGQKLYRRTLSDLDETTLIQIANQTGAKFFRAMDADTINKTFAAIDAAQKIEFEAKSYLITTELFLWLAIPGAALLFLGALFALPPHLPFLATSAQSPAPIASNALAAENAGTPAMARSPAGVLIKICATFLGGVCMFSAYISEMGVSSDSARAAGASIGQVVGALVGVFMLTLFPRMRTGSRRYTLLCTVFLFLSAYNLSTSK